MGRNRAGVDICHGILECPVYSEGGFPEIDRVGTTLLLHFPWVKAAWMVDIERTYTLFYCQD